jgi:NAD(P)-dependent dehydrogenase (short-subunit alcohol dehydrogenase family)
MATGFDISPEKQASFLQLLFRQFFQTPEPVSSSDVNLEGKTAIVTGSNEDIGFKCCQQLQDPGLTKLILAVRDESKGDAAAAKLSARQATGSVEVWKLDMSSYDSIISFVERTTSLERLDILILNAGITRQYSHLDPSTGHEENIQINYLSTVLLTIKTLPVLKSKAPVQQQPSLLVIVLSNAGPLSPFPEQNSDPLLPAFDKPGNFNMLNRYYTSRLLGMFFL